MKRNDMEVRSTQTAVGNTGQRSVSSSSSPPSASVRNQVTATSVGKPGQAGGVGGVNRATNVTAPTSVGLQAGNGLANPIPTGNEVAAGAGAGQNQQGIVNHPDMALIGGLTDSFRSGALNPQQFATQLKTYLSDFRSGLQSQLQGAVQSQRSQAQAKVAAARQQGLQTASQALAKARTTATAAGASPSQLQGISDAEQWLIDRESGGDVNAYNPQATDTGNALGLGQLTTLNRQRYAQQLGISNPDTTDPGEQLAMMRAYINERYGSPEAAKAFWQQNGWY